MKTVLLAAAVAMSGFIAASSAQAATFPVGSANFKASAGPNGTYAGAFFNNGIAAGEFSDTFTFTLPADGFGSGTVTTSANFLGDVNDVDFTAVLINGMAAQLFVAGGGVFEVAFRNLVPITAGQLNTITVTGISRGNGAYGGQASFEPAAVPEPATWALMLAGFGMVGYAMRRRRIAFA